MDKNAIKKYAVWARNELIARVSQKAQQYGITAEGYGDKNADSVNGVLLSATEKKQRQALIAKIDAEGFEQVMEEVAYTWFNRFTALRFMEVNNYLPSHTRVFTNEANEFKPQILADAISLELEGLDMDKVFELKNANKDEELYKYLLIVQCNALSSILPGMFQRISDYTELLLPDYLLRTGSVVEQMVSIIPEDDWNDQVQIIGWLYQYYNSELKENTFNGLKKNIKINRKTLPAATQLFTPDWIVKYMVDNSLGRMWNNCQVKSDFYRELKYYQKNEIEDTRIVSEDRNPEEIVCIDPCAGSGHILCYMFDILIKMYESYGYTARDAASLIVEKNLYGLDIDERAAQLAYFSVMMKARQYDRRFFSRNIQPNVYQIVESNAIDKLVLDYFCGEDKALQHDMNEIISELSNAKDYGSLIKVKDKNWELIDKRVESIRGEISLYSQSINNDIVPMINVAKILCQRYDIIVTNPPYMGIKNMSATLGDYLRKNFPDNKYDLYGIFIENLLSRLKKDGYLGMVTMQTFMFLSRYEYLRRKMLSKDIISFIQLGTRAFEEIGGEVVQTATFVLRNSNVPDYRGAYVDLSEIDNSNEKEQAFLNNPKVYLKKKDTFEKIPGIPFAFWASDKIGEIYGIGKPLESLVSPRQGMATSDNDRFLRLWHEVDINKIGFGYQNRETAEESGRKWFPYNKGGSYRKWYGNAEYVVNWEHDGKEIKEFRDYKNSTLNSNMGVAGLPFIFKKNITWSKVCSARFSVRYLPEGFLFDVSGCSIYGNDNDLKKMMALLNSNVIEKLLAAISQSLNFEVGSIKQLPVYTIEDLDLSIVDENYRIAKTDWDSFETSWDFKKHPLIRGTSIREAFQQWKEECELRHKTLKNNEEKINKYFIRLYGLEDELSPEINDDEIALFGADEKREIKGLISYAVGCMFGRFSLDEEGFVYAGGEWNPEAYETFCADKDNIIPICDDEYFQDDIVNLFVAFIEKAYGKASLDENLTYIASVLGGSGNPRDVIRDYFINSFYLDHLKLYQKKPIYWLFDSGKKNGFKCLIYIHRYKSDTIARIRTDYVHEQQSRYRTALNDIHARMQGASSSERVKLLKAQAKIKEQDDELLAYEEKVHHLADQMISLNMDDGIKRNYEKLADILSKLK